MKKHEYTNKPNYFYGFTSSDYLDPETNFYIRENDMSQEYQEFDAKYTNWGLTRHLAYREATVTPDEAHSWFNRMREIENEFKSLFGFVEIDPMSEADKLRIYDDCEPDFGLAVNGEYFYNFEFSNDPQKNIYMGNTFIRESELQQEYLDLEERYEDFLHKSCFSYFSCFAEEKKEEDAIKLRMLEIEKELKTLPDDTNVTKEEYEEAKKKLY